MIQRSSRERSAVSLRITLEESFIQVEPDMLELDRARFLDRLRADEQLGDLAFWWERRKAWICSPAGLRAVTAKILALAEQRAPFNEDEVDDDDREEGACPACRI